MKIINDGIKVEDGEGCIMRVRANPDGFGIFININGSDDFWINDPNDVDRLCESIKTILQGNK